MKERASVPGYTSPTVRRRRLAAELRRLRERAGLTGDEVAERLGWSPSKVSRYELARTGLKPVEVRRMLDLYGVEGSRREELLALAREGTGKGWWEEYADRIPESVLTLVGMEAEATSEWAWHSDVVPGLVQTESYAQAVVSQLQVLTPILPSQVRQTVAVRLMRQQLLHRDPPLHYFVVLDEAVLRRQIGDVPVMREQLAHLIEIAALPNVSLRVMGLSDKVPVVVQSFDLLGFGQVHTMPDVAWTEHLGEATYMEGEFDTFQYHLLFRALCDSSKDQAESLEFIARIRQEAWS
jgi:transcriptional regulator with XRE-family HTH domain